MSGLVPRSSSSRGTWSVLRVVRVESPEAPAGSVVVIRGTVATLVTPAAVGSGVEVIRGPPASAQDAPSGVDEARTGVATKGWGATSSTANCATAIARGIAFVAGAPVLDSVELLEFVASV